MSVIDVQNLTFAYEGSYKNVFENVSFRIDTDWKSGLVGRNGRGKTTFLRLLGGEYEYRGKITASVKCTYFPFPVADPQRTAEEVLADVCPAAEEWEILREFSYLQMSPDVLYRRMQQLSGGERTKVLLVGLFLRENEFLLIDEPTNHLDTPSRRSVAAYLRRKKGFILVSHDRAFLDDCVDHIVSLNRTNVDVQSGNFSSWYENFQRRQTYESAQNERLKKDITRLSASAQRTAAWSEKTEASKYGKTDAGLKADRGYVGHKAAKMMKSAKSAQTRMQREIERKSELLHDAERADELKLSPLACRTERLLSFADVTVAYGEPVGTPVRFELLRGEKIALEGQNGCGKSSLLRMIAGEEVPHGGTFTLSSGVVVSYVPQVLPHVSGKISRFATARGISEPLLRAILHKMGFAEADDTDIASYSAGQKKKLFVAASLCEQAHVYVWDEPLNYLDIYARMQIETLLAHTDLTMIFVEHDRAFQKAVATKVVEMR